MQNITYLEFVFIEKSILSLHPLESYREGFLTFLDKVKSSIEESDVENTDFTLTVELSDNLKAFLSRELEKLPEIQLYSKLQISLG